MAEDKIEHAQTTLMRSTLLKLKSTLQEQSTKEALSLAVDFTIKNYRKNMEAKQ